MALETTELRMIFLFKKRTKKDGSFPRKTPERRWGHSNATHSVSLVPNFERGAKCMREGLLSSVRTVNADEEVVELRPRPVAAADAMEDGLCFSNSSTLRSASAEMKTLAGWSSRRHVASAMPLAELSAAAVVVGFFPDFLTLCWNAGGNNAYRYTGMVVRQHIHVWLHGQAPSRSRPMQRSMLSLSQYIYKLR